MQAILLIVAAVFLVWGMVWAVRGSLLAGGLTVLVATCCFGPNFFAFDVAGVSLSIDRLLLLLLGLTWLVQWRSGKLPLKPLNAADWSLLVFIGLLTASMLMHDWHSAGVGDVPIPQHLINGYLIPLVLFWVARQANLTERNVTWILAGLAGFGVYLGLTGLLEAGGAWSLVFPRYIADPEVGLHFGRARGPMVHSVSYGIYLSAGLFSVWLLKDRMPARWHVLLASLAMPLMIAAIYFTKTRSVWVGAGSGLLLALAFTLRGRVRAVVLGGMASAALLVGLTQSDAIMRLEREGTAADTRQSADMRMSFAYTSWKMFQDRPLLGFGFGQYATEKLPYLTDRSVDLRLEQIRAYVHHNTFLSVLTETGLIGFGLFLLVLGCWTRAAWRLLRSPAAPLWMRRHGLLMLCVLALAFWQMLAHEITFTPIDNSLIYFLAGISVGLLSSTGLQTATNRAAAGALHAPVAAGAAASVAPGSGHR